MSHTENTVTTTYITGRQYDPPGPDAREQKLVITYSPWSGCEFEDMDESLKLVPVHMVDETRGITYDLLVLRGTASRAKLDALLWPLMTISVLLNANQPPPPP